MVTELDMILLLTHKQNKKKPLKHTFADMALYSMDKKKVFNQTVYYQSNYTRIWFDSVDFQHGVYI